MNCKLTQLLATGVILTGLFALPANASDQASCDAHAKHIDHEIGATVALEAYHVLHGDNSDEHHVIERLKKEHPTVEHELEEFVKSGCTDADLEAHAHDDDAH